HLACPDRARLENVHDPIGLLRERLAPLANRCQRGQEVLEEHVLAVEATDRCRAAPGRAIFAVGRRREDAMEIEHGTHVGITGISPPPGGAGSRAGHRTATPGRAARPSPCTSARARATPPASPSRRADGARRARVPATG